MKYKLILNDDLYLVGFAHTGTDADTYELDPSKMELDFINCYHLVNGALWLDEAKKELVIKERKAEEKHANEISEQTLRLAEMFVAMGVNSNDFLDRLDAQSLYTALMTGTLIESEETLDE